MWMHLKVGVQGTAVQHTDRINVQGIRNLVGAFYEALGAHMLGAEPWEGGEVLDHEDNRGNNDDGSHGLSPDLLLREEAAFVEVKAGNYKSMMKPYVTQSECYARIRARAKAPIYRPRVFYLFFVHGLQGMRRRYNTPQKLFHGLARNTSFALLVDLDIVLAFRLWCGTVTYGDPHGPYYYPPFYKLPPRYVRALVQHPRTCLDSLLGREQLRYSVRRTSFGGGKHGQLPLFEGTTIAGTKVAPFPFVTIKKKRHPRPSYQGPSDRSWKTLAHQQKFWEPPRDEWLPEDIPF